MPHSMLTHPVIQIATAAKLGGIHWEATEDYRGLIKWGRSWRTRPGYRATSGEPPGFGHQKVQQWPAATWPSSATAIAMNVMLCSSLCHLLKIESPESNHVIVQIKPWAHSKFALSSEVNGILFGSGKIPWSHPWHLPLFHLISYASADLINSIFDIFSKLNTWDSQDSTHAIYSMIPAIWTS